MNLSLVLLVIAIILFALAAIGSRVGVSREGPVDLVAAGLFFWALSTLV